MTSTVTATDGFGFQEGDHIIINGHQFSIVAVDQNTFTIKKVPWFVFVWRVWCRNWQDTFPYFSSGFITPDR